jgi:hypothetical protein
MKLKLPWSWLPAPEKMAFPSPRRVFTLPLMKLVLPWAKLWFPTTALESPASLF